MSGAVCVCVCGRVCGVGDAPLTTGGDGATASATRERNNKTARATPPRTARGCVVTVYNLV